MKKKLIDLLSRAFVEVDARDLAALAEYLISNGVVIEHVDDDVVSEATRAAISYLNEVSGRKFRTCPAYRRFVKSILAQGYTLDDIKAVVKCKYEHWKRSPEYARYIRPETLFGPRFQSYVNEANNRVFIRQGNFDPADAMKRAIERTFKECDELREGEKNETV